MQIKFVDAHIHLSDPEYAPILDKVIEDAKKSKVVALVSNSVNLETSKLSIKLAEENPKFVFAAVGVHPWNVQNLTEEELASTVDFILNLDTKSRNHIVAIGEIGLDSLYVMNQEKERFQRRVFHEMLRLAEKLSLPAIIHSRGAANEVFDILASYNLKRVLFHWFSTPKELIPKLVERGYYITEGPPILYSKRIRENVKMTPIENLLTETDGPVRFWGPFKGKTTTPAFIPLIVEEIAKIKGLDFHKTVTKIYENFIRFFDIKEL